MKKIVTLIFIVFIQSTISGQEKPLYDIEVSKQGNVLGTIRVELFPAIAPNHVANFDGLVSQNKYNGSIFHRVIPGFMIQGGGTNDGQTVNAEFNKVTHARGILSAARTDNINSANSQFFICVANSTFLDGDYSAYGRAISGMDIADMIVNESRDGNDKPFIDISMTVSKAGADTSSPAAPTLSLPANGTQGVTTIRSLRWNTVPEAVLYELEVATDPDFQNLFISEVTGKTNHVATQLSQDVTTYYWRTRSNNGGKLGPWSEVYTFTTKLNAPKLSYPTNNETNTPVNPKLEWDTLNIADSYAVQVSRSTSFSAPDLEFDNTNISLNNVQLPTLNSNTDYYWRVKSTKSGVESQYSSIFKFTTGTEVGIMDQPISSLHLAPNPATDYLLINYKLAEHSGIIFMLRDLTGKLILSREVNTSSSTGVERISLKNQNQGIYIASIRTDNLEKSQKIVIYR